jgi:quercetin dioxygenase-like cupin family protein
VLWQGAGQASMLYHAEAGASVPEHGHGHDEECYAVQGEIFLDDLLMQPGDYQVAPAGSGHVSTATDTGTVLFVHGDAELQFR